MRAYAYQKIKNINLKREVIKNGHAKIGQTNKAEREIDMKGN